MISIKRVNDFCEEHDFRLYLSLEGSLLNFKAERKGKVIQDVIRLDYLFELPTEDVDTIILKRIAILEKRLSAYERKPIRTKMLGDDQLGRQM